MFIDVLHSDLKCSVYLLLKIISQVMGNANLNICLSNLGDMVPGALTKEKPETKSVSGYGGEGGI